MAIFQALYVVKRTRPHIQMVYSKLLEGLILAQYDAQIPDRPPTFWFFPAILEILSLVKEVAITPEAAFFDHLCHIMELSARSARKALAMTREDKLSQHIQPLLSSAETFLTVGSTVLRRTFAALFRRRTPDADPEN